MISLMIATNLFVLASMGIAAYVLYIDLRDRSNLQRDLIVSLNQRLKAIEQRPEIVIYSDEKVRWN